MKDKALLAKYRIEGDSLSNKGFAALGLTNECYMIPIDGNQCKVIVSHEYGDTHLSVSIALSETVGRVPTYAECLKIKDILFEKDETLVFGISHNLLMNMIVTNSCAMHMYKYDGPMPPVQKVMEIDDYKVDGDYKITKGKGWGWYFVRVCGDYYPDMDEIRSIKEKYSPQRDVAIFLMKNAVILFSNPKTGISFHHQTMK